MSGIQSTPADRAAGLGWHGDGYKAPTPAAVDHKAEAERILTTAAMYSPAEDNDPDGAAQAHALLALTEQQRIGNIIARLDSLTHSNPGERLTLSGAELAERLSAQLREVGL